MEASGEVGPQLPAGLDTSPVPTGVVGLDGAWTDTNAALDALIGTECRPLADVVDEPGVDLDAVLTGLSGAVRLRLDGRTAAAGDAVITALDDRHRLVQILDRSEVSHLSERLAATTSAMSRFVSRVSHDLKNPLATTAGFAELLQESGGSGPTGVYADRVTTSARRTTEVLDELIAEARGSVELERSDHADVTAVVEEVRTELADLLASRGASLEAGPRLPTVRTDRRSLGRILTLLVDNAVTHHPGAATIRVDACTTRDGIELVVDDDGPGIAVQDRLRVFDAGVAIRAPDNRGLGLTAAEANARRIGAAITFGESPWGGTRATVSLPQRRSGDPDHGPPAI